MTFVGSEALWPYLLAFTAVPCIVSLIVLPIFPDSPRYLLVNCNDEKAAKDGMYPYYVYSIFFFQRCPRYEIKKLY